LDKGGYAGSTEYKTFIKFGGALVQTNARFTFSYRFVIKIRAIVCASIRLPKVYFEGLNNWKVNVSAKLCKRRVSLHWVRR